MPLGNLTLMAQIKNFINRKVVSKMKNLMISDFFAETNGMTYGSVKPSTIMLLDPELYNLLYEDAHPRNNHLYKIKQKEEKDKLKDIGYVSNQKEIEEKYKEIGSRNQNRAYIRKNDKYKKELRKNKTYAEKTKELKDLLDHYTKEYPDVPRSTLSHILRSRVSKQIRDELEQQKNAPIDINKNAAYNSIFNSIYLNKNSIYNYIPEIRDKLVNHEIQHYRDHLYVKNKYGSSAAKKIEAKSMKNNTKDINDPKYRRDSLEYNAVTIGANTNQANKSNVHKQYEDQTHKIMDKAVKGKRTPKITDDMLNAQTPPLIF